MTSQWFPLFIELQSLFALFLEMLFASIVSQKCEVEFRDIVEFLDEGYLEFLHEGYLILSLFSWK